MSGNLLTGRNNVNNKVSPLNVTDLGKLRIDESLKINDIYVQSILNGNTLDRIETDTTELFKYRNKYDIKYLRSQGKCYVAGDGFFRNNITGNHSAFSFFNPSSSGRIAYIYRIKYSYDNEYNDSSTSRLLLLRINSGTPISGSTETPHNLKFSASDASAMECRLQPTTTGLSTNAFCYLAYEDAPSSAQQGQGTLELDEHIEVSEGKGLLFNLIASSSTTHDSRFSCSIWWYELDVNNPEFS
jgi:hypothetical protein